jgi:excisionase family DNA binding protein
MVALIGPPDAARFLGVPRSWVYGACDNGTLPHLRVGRYIKFDPDELRTWLDGQRRGGTPKTAEAVKP